MLHVKYYIISKKEFIDNHIASFTAESAKKGRELGLSQQHAGLIREISQKTLNSLKINSRYKELKPPAPILSSVDEETEALRRVLRPSSSLTTEIRLFCFL